LETDRQGPSVGMIFYDKLEVIHSWQKKK